MTQMSDIERWLAELNDDDMDEDAEALKGLSDLDAHRLLRADLTLAGQVAQAARPWIVRVRNGAQQLQAAALVCRYAPDLALWEHGLAWFRKTLLDAKQPSQYLYQVILNWAVVPDYLPYWDDARARLEALFNDFARGADESLQGSLKEVGRIAELKISIPQAPQSDTVTCQKCGRAVTRAGAIKASSWYFCSASCANAYWGNSDWRNPMNW